MKSKYKAPQALLSHVDYQCGGKVILRDGVLRCTKCKVTSAAGPITVVSEPVWERGN